MRTWLLLSLLLLSILIHEAQGIRLRKGISLPDTDHRQHNIHQEFHPGMINNKGVKEVIQCKSKHCSGRIRKLTMTPISSTATITKNNKNEENKDHPKLKGSAINQKIGSKEENGLFVNSSSSKTTHEQGQAEPYPGILDIAEMDYSLARRKPPIHN
ncbi:hypothetical protein DH2020_010812 [Rehmannia glutinosa]|uniref:Uncharacterized protein n=1 Tax=Rehmannia glutinosa TaxID=99300 RepID=A0ABR0XBM8_REHGL